MVLNLAQNHHAEVIFSVGMNLQQSNPEVRVELLAAHSKNADEIAGGAQAQGSTGAGEFSENS